jgi:hypothetical protein
VTRPSDHQLAQALRDVLACVDPALTEAERRRVARAVAVLAAFDQATVTP